MPNRAARHAALAATVASMFILGTVPEASAAPAAFFTVTPCRVLDSRTGGGGPLVSGTARIVAVAGNCGVAGNASAIALNITAVEATGAGHMTLSAPGGGATGSTINYGALQTRANNAVVRLSSAGGLSILPFVSGSGTVHAIVDVVGYFVDDVPPVAEDDTANVLEDAAATAVDVLANDTDADGGLLQIGSVTQPANGTVAITGGGTGLTYQPNLNYCNTPPGTTLDSFAYTLTPGGDSATVTVTVTCVEDDPVAVDDAATVAEDSAANPIAVLANDSDVDGGAFSILSVTQPANGTVVITGGGTALTYQPTPDYCNDPPGTALDIFTYTLTPGGDTATVSVTVTCADDSPVAAGDAATVAEDSGANAIAVLANDTDVDGGPISISSVTQPANGTVVITGGGTGLTYQPNLNYCNTPPGTALDSFTYTLTPGTSTATVTMSVTCVDDPPLAVADAATVAEDSGANALNVFANDTDVDAGPIAIASVTQPANGTVVITGGGTGLTYQPNPNYCNTPPGTTLDAFSYTLNPGGSSTTVTMTVTCVNDGPQVDLNGPAPVGNDFAANFTEGDPAVLLQDGVDPDGATIADVDGATMTTLTVTLTNLLDPTFEVLDANVTGFPNITKTYDATTNPLQGVLTLSSVTPEPIADFQAVLRTVTYRNTDQDLDGTPRIVEFVANDGTNDGNTATATVTMVSIDAPPVAVADAATVAEDSGASAIPVLANDTDADGGPISIASVTQPANGAVVITGGGTGLTYQPNANYCNTPPGTTLETFTYTLTPGGSMGTVTVTVTCADDSPVAVADAATVGEDSGASAVDVLANDTDADGGAIAVGSVTQPANGTVVITGGGTGLTYAPNLNYCNTPPGTTLDTFTYTLTPGGSSTTVTMTVTCVDDDPVAVDDSGTVTEDASATPVFVLANDTDVDGGAFSVTAVTQPANGTVAIAIDGGSVTYTPNPNYCNNPPGVTPDTFTYTLTPGGDTATVLVTVDCVDDAPVAVANAATVIEDSGANAIAVLANDTDIDGGPISVSSVTQPANGAVVITGGGTGLTYAPSPNYCNNPPGTALDSFTYTLTPGGSSTTVTMTVTCVNDPPTLTTNPITYATAGNTQLHVAGATIAGVASIADAQSALTKSAPVDIDGPVAPAVVAASGASTNGGSFSIAANGSFTYVPPVGFTGTDSFPYQVTDSQNATTGTINVTVSQVVWYVRDVVDANNAAGGDGRSTNAFETLAAAETASLGSQFIFVFAGNTATTPLAGGIALKDGQKLHGQGIGLSVPGFANIVAVGAQPRINNAAGDAVSVPATTGNRNLVEVRGLDLQGTLNAVDVTATGANNVGVTISDNTVRGAGQEGLDLNAGSTGLFTATVQTNTIAATGNGIDARTSAAGLLQVNIGGNVVTSNANGIEVNGSGGGTTHITGFSSNVISGNSLGTGIAVTSATFDSTPGATFQTVLGGNTAVGASGNGVGTSGVVLTNVAGDLSFTDLDVFADAGAALSASGLTAYTGSAGFQIAVGAGSTVAATGGPAVTLNTVTAALPFQQITSTNSASTGVSLVTVPGTFTAGAGSITNATSTDFVVNGSNATVTYAGTITDDVGQLVQVTNTTGGTKTFSGAITDGNDGDGSGISLTTNTGATINFQGGLLLSTGANPAFTATGGGTVNVCDENPCNPAATGALVNTLTTTTGTALNVANTTIGANNLEFRSISAGTVAGSAGIGIVLNTTGATGGLSIKGTGTPGSGGTIQHKTGADGSTADGIGIFLNSTSNVSLNWLQLNDFDNSAITGRSVQGFTLQNSVLNGTIGTASGPTEGPINFGVSNPGGSNGLQGTGLIRNTRISGGVEHNVEFYNQSGAMSLTIEGVGLVSEGVNPNSPADDVADCIIEENSVAFGSDGILIEMQGTSTATVVVNRCLFRDNKSQAVQLSLLDNTVGSVTINESWARRFDQGNEGFLLSNSSNSRLTALMSNNHANGFGGVAFFVGQGPGNATALSELHATISGNVVNQPTTATNSAIIALLTSTVGQVSQGRVRIDGNTITNNSTTGVARGILVDTPDANTSPAFHATVTNNAVAVGDNVNGVGGIVVQGRQSSDACASIGNNSVTFPNGAPPGILGLRARQVNPASYDLEQSGACTGTAATVLACRNPGATTEVLGTLTVAPVGSCLLPNTP